MRVFVIGTGRCGTVTFSKACEHFTNYTVGHESRAGVTDFSRLGFPDNHIEVDAHLAWQLGNLTTMYPGATYVHLVRNRWDVIFSWELRGIHPWGGAAPFVSSLFQTGKPQYGPRYREALGALYDTITANCEMLRRCSHIGQMLTIDLEDAHAAFPVFARAIGAEGDLTAARREFGTRYNASQ